MFFGHSPPLPGLQGCARGLWAGTRCRHVTSQADELPAKFETASAAYAVCRCSARALTLDVCRFTKILMTEVCQLTTFYKINFSNGLLLHRLHKVHLTFQWFESLMMCEKVPVSFYRFSGKMVRALLVIRETTTATLKVSKETGHSSNVSFWT